jgi:protein-S-isoprenylcysteine O-methyltransferase Ste14
MLDYFSSVLVCQLVVSKSDSTKELEWRKFSMGYHRDSYYRSVPGIFGLSIPLFTISLISHSELLRVVCVILVGIGLVIALLARGTLAGNWSNDVVIKVDHELITTGVYRYARHPIYTGVLLMGLGSVLLLGTLSAFLGFLF